jgi:hypothetical protein
MKRLRLKTVLLAGASALPLALAGCGETVQFEGRVFDMMGMNDTSKRQENSVPERAPLVLPPNAKAASLPAPQSQAAAAEENMQWPDDPDERRKAMEAAQKKQSKVDAVKAVDSRYEPQPGLLNRMWNRGGDDEE